MIKSVTAVLLVAFAVAHGASRSTMIPCQYTPWTPWGPCSKPCEGGKQIRTRLADGPEPCTAPLRQNRSCNNGMPCPRKSVVNRIICPRPGCNGTQCRPSTMPLGCTPLPASGTASLNRVCVPGTGVTTALYYASLNCTGPIASNFTEAFDTCYSSEVSFTSHTIVGCSIV
jgi:hypothetical protein